MYVKGLPLKKVREAEQTAEDDADLSRKLFLLIFKQELAEKPHRICCTEADGKELLNQTYLTAICCKSSQSLAGTNLFIPFVQITFTITITVHQRSSVPHWKTILSKLNDRIRYECRNKLTLEREHFSSIATQCNI